MNIQSCPLGSAMRQQFSNGLLMKFFVRSSIPLLSYILTIYLYSRKMKLLIKNISSGYLINYNCTNLRQSLVNAHLAWNLWSILDTLSQKMELLWIHPKRALLMVAQLHKVLKNYRCFWACVIITLSSCRNSPRRLHHCINCYKRSKSGLGPKTSKLHLRHLSMPLHIRQYWLYRILINRSRLKRMQVIRRSVVYWPRTNVL